MVNHNVSKNVEHYQQGDSETARGRAFYPILRPFIIIIIIIHTQWVLNPKSLPPHCSYKWSATCARLHWYFKAIIIRYKYWWLQIHWQLKAAICKKDYYKLTKLHGRR